ncbi:MAG TPA: ribonucleotide-diphosphate reductase subunit alpha, partial [Desulfobacterales bacterium]|nr:ribonucleotide-diphosphate reductase subunit alpha [Desulfobacterales bacterium]
MAKKMNINHSLPTGARKPAFTPNALTVLNKRYLIKDNHSEVVETPQDMFWRVARTIAAGEVNYKLSPPVDELAFKFYEMMAAFDFLPNSPTL